MNLFEYIIKNLNDFQMIVHIIAFITGIFAAFIYIFKFKLVANPKQFKLNYQVYIFIHKNFRNRFAKVFLWILWNSFIVLLCFSYSLIYGVKIYDSYDNYIQKEKFRNKTIDTFIDIENYKSINFLEQEVKSFIMGYNNAINLGVTFIEVRKVQEENLKKLFTKDFIENVNNDIILKKLSSEFRKASCISETNPEKESEELFYKICEMKNLSDDSVNGFLKYKFKLIYEDDETPYWKVDELIYNTNSVINSI